MTTISHFHFTSFRNMAFRAISLLSHTFESPKEITRISIMSHRPHTKSELSLKEAEENTSSCRRFGAIYRAG